MNKTQQLIDQLDELDELDDPTKRYLRETGVIDALAKLTLTRLSEVDESEIEVVNPKWPSKAKPGTPTEQREATALVEWAQWHGSIRDHLAHVMNEHTSGKASHGAIKRAEGVRAGFPDYLFDVARGGWYGLRIELKRIAGSRHTDDQQTWQRRHLSEGYLHVVAPGWRVAAAWLTWYVNQLDTSARFLPTELHASEFKRNRASVLDEVVPLDATHFDLAPQVIT